MLDLLMNRRSIRKYKDQEVPQDIIDKIIKGALSAPSSRNKKPWELIVVNDKDILTKLSMARGAITAPIKSAALGIVVMADPELTDMWVEDSSIVATIIQLTAQSLGLGSVWLQVRERLNDNNENVEILIKDVLKIPEKYSVECMISIGYPNEEKDPHKEESLAYDKVHKNKF